LLLLGRQIAYWYVIEHQQHFWFHQPTLDLPLVLVPLLQAARRAGQL
jgi:hypothetical protein